MLRHFFQIAWRNLMKRKLYSFINIAGLTIGMACCVLIAVYILNELSYDRYHLKSDRIYRVTQAFRSIQKGENPGPPAPRDFQVWGCAPVGLHCKQIFLKLKKWCVS